MCMYLNVITILSVVFFCKIFRIAYLNLHNIKILFLWNLVLVYEFYFFKDCYLFLERKGNEKKR